MINLKMYKYLCFIALLFCVCTQTPDNCGDYERVDYKTEFCYDGKAVPKCAGNKYNPAVEKCADDGSKVEEKCINGKYAKSGEPCITAFTVKFDTDGGTPETVSPVTVDSGKTMGSKFPEDPKKTGLIFDGWFHNDKKYDSSTVITENVTIKAKFRLKQFTVRFDTDGGTPETISSVTVDTGKTMGEKLPSNPAKMGFTFDGWFNEDNKYDSSTVITKDVTLKARYQVKRFTVQFNTDGGSPSTISPIVVDTGKTIGTENFPSAPTKTGFSFDGWYYADGASYYTSSTPITQNVTLRAQWREGETSTTKYTLTTSSDPSDGGTVNPTSGQTYESGHEVTVTATPNAGYNFVEWSGASNSKSNEVKIIMNENRSLTAKFELKKYTVTFDTDGGTPETMESIVVDTGKTIGSENFPDAPTKDGYTFGGWFDGDEKYDANTVITKSVTLKAKWTIKTYTLTTGANPANGGNVTRSLNLESYEHGTQVTVTAIAVEGYNFAGWSGASTSTTNPHVITMDSDKELTAIFEAIPVTYYTLQIEINPSVGGNVSRDRDGVYSGGTKVIVTAEPADGYKFVNWSGALNSANESLEVIMNADITLTANFVLAYTLTAVSNPSVGGTVSINTQMPVTSGTQVSISANTTRGYTFVNWTVTGSGAAIANANNASTTVTLTANATVTANFIVKPSHLNPDINYGVFTDTRDGKNQIYHTVKIGGKTWMAENLNYETDNSWCYNDIASNCNMYGRLYDWDAAMAACPTGWSLPDYNDQTDLISAAGDYDVAGKTLKSKSNWNNRNNGSSGNGTDDLGFSALPGGYRDYFGDFSDIGSYGEWWLITDVPAYSIAYSYSLYSQYDNIGSSSPTKRYGLSVRCIQD